MTPRMCWSSFTAGPRSPSTRLGRLPGVPSWLSSAAQVSGPMPLGSHPCIFWKRSSAFRVTWSNVPVSGTPSSRCTSLTPGPVSPISTFVRLPGEPSGTTLRASTRVARSSRPAAALPAWRCTNSTPSRLAAPAAGNAGAACGSAATGSGASGSATCAPFSTAPLQHTARGRSSLQQALLRRPGDRAAERLLDRRVDQAELALGQRAVVLVAVQERADARSAQRRHAAAQRIGRLE